MNTQYESESGQHEEMRWYLRHLEEEQRMTEEFLSEDSKAGNIRRQINSQE